jgi:hypothetical protein
MADDHSRFQRRSGGLPDSAEPTHHPLSLACRIGQQLEWAPITAYALVRRRKHGLDTS